MLELSYQKSTPQANEVPPLERMRPWESAISTTDLYEATFYLLGGCELLGIEATRVNGGIACRLSFSGPKLEELQSEYFAGKAKVPLFPFRRAFGQVNALVYSAKKKAKSRLRQQETAEGGST